MRRRDLHAACLWLACALGACAPAGTAVEPPPQASARPAPPPAESGHVCSESAGAANPALSRVVVRGGSAAACEKIESRAGAPVDEGRVDRDLRALFAEKSLEDVVVVLEESASGRVLAFELKGLPRLESIEFQGASALDRTALLAAAGLGEPFFRATRARRGAEGIQQAYRDRGYRRATVEWSTQNVSKSALSLVFRVVEGPLFTLRTVKVTGNKAVKEAEIRAALEPHMGQPLDGDGESVARSRVEMLYYDNGMVNASVTTKEIVEGPGGALELVLEVKEGPVFHVDKVTFTGDACVGAPAIRKAMKGLVPKAVFQRSKITADVTALETACRAAGKAGKVELSTEVDPKKSTISVTARFVPGT